LNNNKYDASVWDKINKEKRRKQDDQKEKKRWAKFTYIGKETRLITKLFKNTNVKVIFTTNNTIEKRLMTKYKNAQNTYDKNRVYQLTSSTNNGTNNIIPQYHYISEKHTQLQQGYVIGKRSN
jgi:hypothetical protein